MPAGSHIQMLFPRNSYRDAYVTGNYLPNRRESWTRVTKVNIIRFLFGVSDRDRLTPLELFNFFSLPFTSLQILILSPVYEEIVRGRPLMIVHPHRIYSPRLVGFNLEWGTYDLRTPTSSILTQPYWIPTKQRTYYLP